MALLRQFEEPSNRVESPTEPAFSKASAGGEGWIGPEKGDVICLMGGAEMFRLRQSVFSDLYFHAAWPDRELRIRNTAWPGDTVYSQQRPMYFFTEKGFEGQGSVPDGREKLVPGTMVLQFGRMESFDGPDKVGEFEEAYRRLVDGMLALTPRVVLVSPVPFTNEARNEDLETYTEAARRVAESRRLLFVDAGPFELSDYDERGWSLSDSGLPQFARRIVEGMAGMEEELGLGKELVGPIWAWVEMKQRLWDQYYRPTNWAFLYGDRQTQPSSRDHRDPNRRWFEEELKKIPPMIREMEERIWALAKEGAK